ncbi:transposase [Leptospira sp. WS58.C1]|uniref:transposase n=1 Tax=Leptospira cinconiae TaxID=3235173 RepID=UPI00349EC301
MTTYPLLPFLTNRARATPAVEKRNLDSGKRSSSKTSSKFKHAGINIPFFEQITKKILNDFYKKFCPHCEDQILDKEISTRPDVIRCRVCHYQTSRLSSTPLQQFKLPLWMFGYVFHESFIQHPKVLTSTEITKRLGISYKAALLLKRRFQIFASEQLEIYKRITFKLLEDEFRDFNLPPNENTDITKKMAKRSYICADTAVLYSASARANKGRKRFRHSGATASIYLSDKLGGKQIGTLVHTIAVKRGPVFFHSVPNQKANTLGPIIKEHLPIRTPLFTDQGYRWLWGIYRNHRSVNHNAKSKKGRYRWARNRWSKYGVHSQVAEGNQRLLKTSFGAYCYTTPEYSTLYLNEFAFLKNAKVLGLDILIQDGAEDSVGIGAMLYGPSKTSRARNKSLQPSIDKFRYSETNESVSEESIIESGYALLNSKSAIEKAKVKLSKEMLSHNQFWNEKKGTYSQRRRELEHQKLANKIWNMIIEKKEKGSHISVSDLCTSLRIRKVTANHILKKWIKLKLIEKRRKGQAWYDRTIDFYIKPKANDLPFLLYTKFKKKVEKNSKVKGRNA